jgi:hypothetical protein
MSGVVINNIVKRSISLSPAVNKWAEELAESRGFGTNFSAFIADLVRRAQENETASSPSILADSIVASAMPATPLAVPVSYRSKPKAAGRSKSPRERGSK